jgi:hypothetical protein
VWTEINHSLGVQRPQWVAIYYVFNDLPKHRQQVRFTLHLHFQMKGPIGNAVSPSSEAFGKLIAEEVTRWREVAKAAGLEAQ